MITENDIKELIKKAKDETKGLSIDATEIRKFHSHLSKAFVAGLGRFFRSKFTTDEYETRFKGYENGKGVSGEWLFDTAVVRVKSIVGKNNKLIKYPCKIVVAIESELDPGSKAFADDFSKLLIVDAENKLYVNGVKNKTDKEKYIRERMELINSILNSQSDASNYFICYVDHPSFWKNKDVFVRILEIRKN